MYNGKLYKPCEKIQDKEGCNTCMCNPELNDCFIGCLDVLPNSGYGRTCQTTPPSDSKYVCQYGCHVYKPGETFNTRLLCKECICEESGEITCKPIPNVACAAVIATSCDMGDIKVDVGQTLTPVCKCGGDGDPICRPCTCDTSGEMVCNNKNAICDNDYWERHNDKCDGKYTSFFFVYCISHFGKASVELPYGLKKLYSLICKYS